MQVDEPHEFRNRTPKFVKNNDLVFNTRHVKPKSIAVTQEGPRAFPVDIRREGAAGSLRL